MEKLTISPSELKAWTQQREAQKRLWEEEKMRLSQMPVQFMEKQWREYANYPSDPLNRLRKRRLA